MIILIMITIMMTIRALEGAVLEFVQSTDRTVNCLQQEISRGNRAMRE